jgi:tRNA-guanine family transglycosylase
MATFALRKNCVEGHARLGTLYTQQGNIQTPCLFPVMTFIGGTTINCGGLWKYIRSQLFEAKLPLMSETMHFLNFNISPDSLQRWREKNLHEWFPDFKSPLFLDSGGFQLLNNKEFDLERYKLSVAPKQILDLQLDFGGDIIVTLDYPLPPTLNDSEAQERIQFSIENAMETLRLLQIKGDTATKVYVPLHGRTPSEITSYIDRFLLRYNRSRLERRFDGFAIGSLVPLRNKPDQIIGILAAAKKSLTEKRLDRIPVHVFGVGSTLIPYLVYLGFDTFDSSTYVQKARNLQYSHPDTWANQRATKLEELVCQCLVCQHLDVGEMRSVLNSDNSFQLIGTRFKSEFYAHIAMHNLNLHLKALEEAISAAENECLEDYLIEFAERRIYKGNPIAALAAEFPEFKKKIGRTLHTVVKPSVRTPKKVSLKYKPSDFSIPSDYKVPKRQRILFLFPCSKEKPYSTSQTFKRISAAVHTHLNGTSKKIHFVVVSGLYGPVPLKYDRRPETKNYDFVLTFRNHVGIQRVGDRLASYMKEYGENFEHVVAFAASKPYRKAIFKGLEGLLNTHIFPKHKSTASTGRTAQFRQGLEECLDFLKNIETATKNQ